MRRPEIYNINWCLDRLYLLWFILKQMIVCLFDIRIAAALINMLMIWNVRVDCVRLREGLLWNWGTKEMTWSKKGLCILILKVHHEWCSYLIFIAPSEVEDFRGTVVHDNVGRCLHLRRTWFPVRTMGAIYILLQITWLANRCWQRQQLLAMPPGVSKTHCRYVTHHWRGHRRWGPSIREYECGASMWSNKYKV
jgi:hypothetical protein